MFCIWFLYCCFLGQMASVTENLAVGPDKLSFGNVIVLGKNAEAEKVKENRLKLAGLVFTGP